MGGSSPADAFESKAMADCPRLYTQAQHAKKARAVYGGQKVTRKAQRRVLTLRSCQHSLSAGRNAKRLTRRLRTRYKQRKAATPYGKWSIPAAIVMCESKGSFTAQNPSGAYGAYQLMPTWWSHLGRKPTPAEQHVIAAKLWNGGAGRSNWVC